MNQQNNMEYHALSLVGLRKENEDNFQVETLNNTVITSLADGVGGRSCGSLASKFSISNFHQKLKLNIDAHLEKVIQEVNDELIVESKQSKVCEGMATTFTGCVISGFNLKGIHAGDSRLCVLRGNGIKELTIEHSEAASLYRKRAISKEQYLNYPRKNIIESALGIKEDFLRQPFDFLLQPKDRIILTTDGFHNVISKVEVRDFSLSNLRLLDLYKTLEKELQNRKLSDNATFIIMEVS